MSLDPIPGETGTSIIQDVRLLEIPEQEWARQSARVPITYSLMTLHLGSDRRKAFDLQKIGLDEVIPRTYSEGALPRIRLARLALPYLNVVKHVRRQVENTLSR